MAELLHIERVMEKALIKERGEGEGKSKFGAYASARDRLMKDVLPEIKGINWQLTDHGVRHIEHVLNNVGHLLGRKADRYSGTELYCLLLSILFHDVGNIFDRLDHQRNITAVYEFVRPASDRNRQEQYIIERTAAAHCGAAPDGSNDTLRFVDAVDHLDSRPVRLRELAAMLRLADELAEGPQRTSLFMQYLGKYPRGSSIYHEFAKATEVCIDRGTERIALTLNVNVQCGNRVFTEVAKKKLAGFVAFAHQRIIKLEQERRYARHYCDLLAPFKKTTVVFNYWIDGRHTDLDLEPIVLTDLVVPGDPHKGLCEKGSHHSPENVVKAIERFFKEKRSL